MILPPRLNDSSPTNVLMNKLQVSLNDVGRAIIRSSKSDRKKVEEVLQESNIPSINQLVIKTICVETWKALNVRDANNVGLNPLGMLLDNRPNSATRAANLGCLQPPAKRLVETFLWWGYTCWNLSPSLRMSPTLAAARRAAAAMAATAPL